MKIKNYKFKIKKPKVLCVCTMGLNRSKYLSTYLKRKGYKTKYGGIGPCKIDSQPANPVCPKDIEWADVIIAVRKKHESILKECYNIKGKKLIILEVTDSRKKISEIHPEFKKMKQSIFNKKWTHPQLRKAIKPYLPLKI